MSKNNGSAKDKLQNSIQRNGCKTPIATADMLCLVYPNLGEYLTKYLCVKRSLMDTTLDCDLSLLEGAFLVEQKFLEMSELYHNRHGVAIPIPAEIQQAMLRWRTLYHRYNSGDFRHRDSEARATKEVAQWTVDEQRKLKNQDPIQVFE